MNSHCPKWAARVKAESKTGKLRWMFPAAGLLSLLWFLFRVVPKPSRAAYPCQRAAAPLAGGFVIWLAGAV